MHVQPTTLAGVADAVTALVAERPGRVRVVLDGPPPAAPGRLAADVGERLRTLGRAVLAVDAADFLRPASVRLELGREDPDALLDLWLDTDALRREVLRPDGPVLPRLWNAAADRSWRAGYVDLPADATVLLYGSLLLGRGLPAEVAVHLRMGAAALARHLPAWQLPAYARYEREHRPEREADLTVLADHPERPALRRR